MLNGSVPTNIIDTAPYCAADRDTLVGRGVRDLQSKVSDISFTSKVFTIRFAHFNQKVALVQGLLFNDRNERGVFNSF